MRKVLLIGPVPTLKPQGSFSEVWCVDGGVDQANSWGLSITKAAGDWDSVKGPLNAIDKITFSTQKSASDLALTLEHLKGTDIEIEAVGLTGGRPDHHWASLAELAVHSAYVRYLSAVDSTARYWFLAPSHGKTSLNLVKNSLFSVFAMPGTNEGESTVLSLQGAQYELDRAELLRPSHGLSNIAHSVAVTIHSGLAMVVAPH